MLKKVWSGAFFRHEVRMALANGSLPVFLSFGWVLVALLTFYAGGFLAANRDDAVVMMTMLPWVMALLVPALTMHTWGQDFKTGVAERLLSLPVPLSALYLTRFAVLWLVVGVFLLGTWPFVATLFWLGWPDAGPLLTGYLGQWLLGGVMLAAGLAVAARARGVISAFMGSFILLLVLLVSGWVQVVDALQGLVPDALLATLRGVSLTGHVGRFVAGMVDVRSVGFLSAVGVGFLLLGLLAVLRRAEQSVRVQAGGVVFGLAVVGVMLAALTGVDVRVDATRDRLFTLSAATRGVLATLPEPVQVTVFDSVSLPDAPPGLLEVRKRLKDVLRDVTDAAHGKVRVMWRDPWASLPAQVSATEAGLQPLATAANQPAYMGMVGTMGGRSLVILQLDVARIPFLEYDVATLLGELQKTRRKVLTVVSGVNVADPKLKPDWLDKLGQFYTMKYALPGNPKLDADTDVVVVYPSPFLPMESLYAFDQYMVKGGRALILVDPYLRSALSDDLNKPDRNADALGVDHIGDVLRAWGITYDWNALVGSVTQATPVRQREANGAMGLGYTTYPLWLTLDGENVNHGLPFTSHVDRLLLPEAGELTVGHLQSGLRFEPVLETDAHAQVMTREQFDHTHPELAGGVLAGPKKERILGGLVYGNFGSMFGAMPDVVKQYYADYGVPSSSIPPFETHSDVQGAAVVMADADWTDDAYTLDEDGARPVNDNLPFLYNTLQYLSGDGSLLGLRAKGTSVPTLVRLEEMLNVLNARYVRTEQTLTGRMFEITQRVAQLQGRQNASAALGDQDTRDLLALQREEMDLKQQLRQIRQDFSTVVARWNHILAWLNALAMPLLVGLWVVLRRRRRG